MNRCQALCCCVFKNNHKIYTVEKSVRVVTVRETMYSVMMDRREEKEECNWILFDLDSGQTS